MALTRRRFLAICAAASVAGPSIASPIIWRGYAMGANVSVTLSLPPAEANTLFRQIEAELKRIEGLFSLYDPASHLSRLNRDAVVCPPETEMLALLTLCDMLHTATEGRFDPTVQPLWQASARIDDRAKAQAAIGWGRVRIAPDKVEIGNGQALTLNGIAQGYATDLITALLAEAGLRQVLVNIGEFSGLGGPWQMGISDPVNGIIAQRVLRNGAMATSSPSAMMLANGQSHILDPREDPAVPQWSTVCVQASSAAIADGASTALCLATFDEAQDIVSRLPEVYRVTFVSENGDVRDVNV